MVPVLDKNKKPLMPCSEKRARKLMEAKKAKPYWYKGVFCIILQFDPETGYKQEVGVGVDPGSKFSGMSVKSAAHTLLNIQYNAPVHVKGRITERRGNRGARRANNTPYRVSRVHRRPKSSLPPSTMARWQQHLNLIVFVSRLYPLKSVVIEDIQAKTKKGARKWNTNFSPIEVGKNWFYREVASQYNLTTFTGYETYEIRNRYGLKKNKQKTKKCFYTHAVDAWCIVSETIGGEPIVDNCRLLCLKPFSLYRRKLHLICPSKGGVRRKYGGTVSEGIRRGTLVKHPKWGFTTVGGSSKGKLSLHHISTHKRLTTFASKEDVKVLTNIKWEFTTIQTRCK